MGTFSRGLKFSKYNRLVLVPCAVNVVEICTQLSYLITGKDGQKDGKHRSMSMSGIRVRGD